MLADTTVDMLGNLRVAMRSALRDNPMVASSGRNALFGLANSFRRDRFESLGRVSSDFAGNPSRFSTSYSGISETAAVFGHGLSKAYGSLGDDERVDALIEDLRAVEGGAASERLNVFLQALADEIQLQ